MLKVLVVSPWFWPAHCYGGPIRSLFAFCSSVARLGAQVRVVTTDANGRGTRLPVDTRRAVRLEPGLEVQYCRRLAFDSVSVGLLRRLGDAVRWADVVHLNCVYSFPTFPTLALCRALGKPLVWSPRGMLQKWERRRRPLLKQLWVALCAALMPRRTLLHFTSVQEAAESTSLASAARLLCPNGVEIPERLGRKRTPPDLRLLYLGRLDPIKGIDNLLRACGVLEQHDGTRWRLSIAGGGDKEYEGSLRALARDLGLDGRVQWLGPVGEADKRRLLTEAAAVVVPSHRESFGMVVAEALAHGTPVVAARGTPWEELERRGCGLWVANHPESLARALLRLRSLPLSAMGERGRRWMKEEYDWSSVARRLLEAYHGLVRPPERAGA